MVYKLNKEEKLAVKRAVHDLCKAVMMDLDEYDALSIHKRGFEIKTEDGKNIQIILDVWDNS